MTGNSLYKRLMRLGWQEVEHNTLALGNLTFSIEYDEVDSPGGAMIRQWASPWDPLADDDNTPEFVGRFPIWLDYPPAIQEAIEEHLRPSGVMAQIRNAIKASELVTA